jgi:hypothetical protein
MSLMLKMSTTAIRKIEDCIHIHGRCTCNNAQEDTYIYMNTRQRRTRTVQDDKIFHPAKLVWTYSKTQELRICKTHRWIEMTSMHTPCKLINQKGLCKIHHKCKSWCANKKNYITQRAAEPSKYHQLIKICQAKNPKLFSQLGWERKS